MDGELVRSFEWIPSGASRCTFAWRLWKGIPLGSSNGGFVAKWESKVIGEVGGATLGEELKR